MILRPMAVISAAALLFCSCASVHRLDPGNLPITAIDRVTVNYVPYIPTQQATPGVVGLITGLASAVAQNIDPIDFDYDGTKSYARSLSESCKARLVNEIGLPLLIPMHTNEELDARGVQQTWNYNQVNTYARSADARLDITITLGFSVHSPFGANVRTLGLQVRILRPWLRVETRMRSQTGKVLWQDTTTVSGDIDVPFASISVFGNVLGQETSRESLFDPLFIKAMDRIIQNVYGR